jgi:hypothetical protein
MGTSGAYGGSGSGAWGAARDAAAAVAGDGPGETAPGTGQGADDSAAAAAAAIAEAMVGEEPPLGRAPRDISLPTLLPHARAIGGGRGGGVADGGRPRGASQGSGRTGGSSRRNMSAGVQRGGTALGAAYSLRAGDRAGLAQVGLDLEALQALPAAGRVSRILDAILGPATHPDEQVLREAAAEQIKAIVMGDTAPTMADAIRSFVATYVWKMGMLELRAQYPGGLPPAEVLLRRERDIKSYIKARIQSVQVAATVTAANLKSEAAKVLRDVLRVLRAGRPAT